MMEKPTGNDIKDRNPLHYVCGMVHNIINIMWKIHNNENGGNIYFNINRTKR